MRTWLIIALLTAVALSGCASEETPETVDDTTQDGPAASDGNGTIEGDDDPVDMAGNTTDDRDDANATNEVPVVTFTADVVNGTAPLLVNFTLDVEDDSENLTWTFFVDGNETLTGIDVPATFNHTFDEGVWNVTVEVSDGEHTLENSLSITALEAVEELPDIVFEGSVLLPDAPWGTVVGGCLMDAGRRDAGGPEGITGTRHDLDSTAYGRSYSFDVDGVVAEFWPSLTAASSGTVPADSEYLVVCINDPTVAAVDYVLTLVA